MESFRHPLSSLAGEIKWDKFWRAMIAVSPIIATAFISGDPRWFRAGLVSISSHIAADRMQLMPLGVLLQGAAILLGYTILLYSLLIPALFVVACGLFGAMTIALMVGGSTLRFIGTFTFIPSLYLACESGEGTAATAFKQTLVTFLPYVAAAMIPVLIIATVLAVRARPADVRSSRYFLTLARGPAGDPVEHLTEMMLTVAIGVGLSSAVVQWQELHNGQWAIWSSASVVTGDVVSSRAKMENRMTGAVMGVPIGIVFGLLLPHNAYSYGLAVLGTLLTLDMFKRYVVQFTSTCTLVATSLMLAGGTPGIAAERTINVVTGGAIGTATYIIMHAVSGALQRRLAKTKSA